jgi:hypothetical protein
MTIARIDFTELAGISTLEKLENEFQYQMDLSDGCYFFWHHTEFLEHAIYPAKNAKAQAILQFLAHCACPISLLRLACSLSPRNFDHGPITSDEFTVHYMLYCFEVVSNCIHDPKIRDIINIYRKTTEFRSACELLITYQSDIISSNICPTVLTIIAESLSSTESRVH